MKYICKHYNVGKDEKVVNQHLKMALRAGVKNGNLKQSKGTGASGSFRLGEKKAEKKPKKAAAKKPKAKVIIFCSLLVHDVWECTNDLSFSTIVQVYEDLNGRATVT